jgi:hypothetical protein
MFFQGVPWAGMKQAWRKMIPMLKGWNVLVHVRLKEDYEGAMAKRLVMQSKRILNGQVHAASDRVSVAKGNSSVFFDPPWYMLVCSEV